MNPPWRTRVKICGIRRTADLLEAARLGADAIGLVFFPASPRAISPEQAKGLLQACPPFLTTVGLFVNAAPDAVRAVLDQVSLDLLQFHGEEPPDYCQSFGRPWIKALRMRPEIDLKRWRKDYGGAAGFLLDTYAPGIAGGTGQAFDWQRIPADWREQIILAGGLHAQNVAEAIRQVRPYGVDVSGGVEGDTKGVKDPAKMAAFMGGVRDGDRFR